MKLTYKKLGEYIVQKGRQNRGLENYNLLGINNAKKFVKAKTNLNGIDLSDYRIVENGQFAFNRATTRNGDKISVALRQGDPCIVSPSYRVFEIKDTNELDPDYLMMWFCRPEFDRYARFKSHGSAHEFFDYDEMCDVELPVPEISIQREVVNQYNSVCNQIEINSRITKSLIDIVSLVFESWFIDYQKIYPEEYLVESNHPDFGQIPKGWKIQKISEIASKIGSGSTPKGGKDSYHSEGISLIRSMNVHDNLFNYDDLAYIDNSQAKKLSNVEVNSNDVLLNITGVSVARCCVTPKHVLPARVNQHVMIIRPRDEISHYLQAALSSNKYKKQLLSTSDGASTRQALTKDDVQQFQILFPDEFLLGKFEDFAGRTLNYVENLNAISRKLNRLRMLILGKMAKS